MTNNQQNTLSEIKELTDVYTQCIHCGMCLTSCPTYELTGLETSSPRGRIKLIRSVAEGKLPVTETFAWEMNFCLDCQACETACPAGVKYGRMVEAARVEVENQGYGSLIKTFFIRYIIPYKKRLKFTAKLLGIYQKSGLQEFVRSTGILNKLFPVLGAIEDFAPDIPEKFSDDSIPEINKPRGEEKFKVAFSYGCLMNVLLPEVNHDTVELLNKLGAVVISPEDQTCCGSLCAHNGDLKTAKELAARNLRTFINYNYDFLVSNSAGCGAFMKEYGELLANDEELADAAKIFSTKILDLTEFLASIEMPEIKNLFDKSVTYHDACHLVHTQKVYQQPRDVLKKIPGLNFIPLEDSTKCCGSAGIYNLIHPETAGHLLKMKVENIAKTKAEVVLTGNPGCLIQIKYGIKKFNKNVTVQHPATFLNNLL